MAKRDTTTEQSRKLMLELRRGTLVLATLSQLRSPKYGYSLLQDLAAHGLEVEQGTLYPLLRRLDEQGLLESSWSVEGSRPRKYYQLNPAGTEALDGLTEHWLGLVEIVSGLLAAEEPPDGEGDGNEPD